MAKDVFFRNVPPQKPEPPEEQPYEDITQPRARLGRGTAERTESAARAGQAYGSPEAERAAARTVPSARRKPKKKKHVFSKLVLTLLILSVLAAGAAFGACGYVLSDYSPVELKENAYVEKRDLMHGNGVFNVLLMGVDTAETKDSTRSDAMIVMSVDTVHGKIKLTSFMRDMYVSIPGHGDTKLTHACMYEGPQLTVDTIELNFGIDIDAYVKIGYDVFIDLVNGVGGITVAEIDGVESRALAEEHVNIAPGTNIHLTGEQAIKYVRIRHGQSDFARTERQREAITLIVKEAKKTSPKKLLELAKLVAGKVESSVPKSELIKLALRALPCFLNDIEQQQIPADGTWSDAYRDSLAVLLVDFQANKEIIRNFIYGR